MVRSATLALMLLCATRAVARAGDADVDADAALVPPHKSITAARTTTPIAIDGDLSDPTWRAATWTSDFVDKEPVFGAPPAHPTQIAIAYDDDALYVAARMWSADRADVDDGVTRRDDGTQAERIIVSLDPFRSRHVAYSFAVTAGGVRIDWLHTDDDAYQRDYSWDPVWEAAVTPLPDGWTAEMRIPLGQLRFPRDARTWGINFNRYIPHRQEDTFWIATPRSIRAWSSWFGELRGLDGLRPGRHVELIPYASVGGTLIESPRGALEDTARPTANVGADAKIGLGPGLTLTGTLNPDFGQVEADPAIVNLTAYEVRLPERRPFFIEGSQIFGSAVRSYFYSRRVGGLPALDLTYDELRPPQSARILGAAKLSGQLAPHTNVGALAAITGDQSAPLVLGGVRSDIAVAPLTGWGVARLERELGDAGSTAGLTVTTVGRHLDDPLLAAQLAKLAIAGGADVRLRPDHGRYEITADVGGSAVSGSTAAITRLQRASAHYFQRPDQTHALLDPNATSLHGFAADVGAAKRAGTWLWDAGFTAESPGFDTNDAGTLMSADDLDWFVDGMYEVTQPSDHLHHWHVRAGAASGWNFGGTRKPGDVFVGSAITLPSFATADATVTIHYPGLLDDLTRGGPLMRDGAGATLVLNAGSTPNRPTVVNATATATWSETGARGVTGSVSLTSLPTSRLRLQITPRLLWQRVVNQYVDTVDDAGGGADTYGARYLFASLSQRELAAQLRAALALSPDLALDAYVEPFVSVGRYTDLGELSAARTSDIRRYADLDRTAGTITVRDGQTFSLTDPDFTAVSLRSTVVLRWEIHPGTILYAVWQQSRGRTDGYADPIARTLGRPFAVPGEHTIAVKLTWWFAP